MFYKTCLHLYKVNITRSSWWNVILHGRVFLETGTIIGIAYHAVTQEIFATAKRWPESVSQFPQQYEDSIPT